MDGKFVAYYRNRERGFSALGYETEYSALQYGVRGDMRLSNTSKFAIRADSLEDGNGQHRKRAEAVVSEFVTDHVEIKAGAAADDSNQLGKRAEVGGKAIYHFDRARNVYVLGQTTVATWDHGKEVHRIGVGAEWQITDRWGLKGQVSTGTGGLGALAGVKYKAAEGEEYYIAYELPDRTNVGTSTGTSIGNLVIGSRKRFSDTLSVFGEEKALHGHSGVTGLTHAYGVDYTTPKGWTARVLTEVGVVDGLDRTAVAGQLGYKLDWFKGGISGEYRHDESLSYGTRDTYAGRVTGLWKLNDSLRFQSKLNGTISEATGTKYGAFDAEFFEGSVGLAFRPVNHDKLNVLTKYSYLYDLPPLHQLNGTTLGIADFKQRSHLFSIDASYDLNRYMTVGAKYGLKIGEQTGSLVSDDWFKSNAELIAAGIDIHLPFEWDAFAEVRMLRLPEIDQVDHGVVVGAYKHLGNNVKLGVGYNFGHFSGDLANPEKDEHGWFANVITKW
ncbi:MAG: hypothetical protein R3D67_07720 [Hyphomicrobiaceae bacterium]